MQNYLVVMFFFTTLHAFILCGVLSLGSEWYKVVTFQESSIKVSEHSDILTSQKYEYHQ